jgi:hypothetical protein
MKKYAASAFVTALIALLVGTAAAQQPRPFAHPERIHYDGNCLTIDGKDTFIFSGAFHYFRCPKELWRDRFQKIKDAGFNAVESYVAWNWHEREMPKSLDDFSKVDLRDLDEWLTMAEEFGFYILIRPGPYICAEWDGGGFPQWLATKKPAQPLRKEMWFRSDDPVFLAWSKHWYDAVCPVIAKHQITRKPPGSPGVILFQIENEYNYTRLPAAVMLTQLTALAKDAIADGIDVPLFTCWTQPIRGVKDGVLRGVFDCTNFYTRFNVEKDVRHNLEKLRSQQPDAPLATTEMQGGWFSKVGGKLSDQQDGLTAAQIQNLTLFSWQLGETITNYYMLFGGTNFDEWGARTMTASYDYDAPIREHGGVGDRYQRVWALGQMLREHGPKLARAESVNVDATATDKDVQIAERKAKDGGRYIFIRTENHTASLAGTAHVKEKNGTAPELVFDYKLEPFGSLVLYLPPGVNDAKRGEWLPKSAPEIKRPTDLPAAVEVTDIQRSADRIPVKWARLQPGEHVEDRGLLNRHFIYYRVAAKSGANVSLDKREGDTLLALAGGKFLKVNDAKTTATFTMPQDATKAVLLLENTGQPNGGRGMEDLIGVQAIHGADESVIEFSQGEYCGSNDLERGEAFSRAETELSKSEWHSVSTGESAPPDALLTWYHMKFDMPANKPGVWVPWHLHIEATGNGFLYLNGHALGRYWQAGPQHDFFLPECWLNFGAGKTNVIALNLRPADKGVRLQAAKIVPAAAFAEFR